MSTRIRALSLALPVVLALTGAPAVAAPSSVEAREASAGVARVQAPTPGAYRSPNGGISFRVSSGKPRIAGFRAFLTGTCGGYPDFPSYASGYYSFPTIGIPSTGNVKRKVKGTRSGSTYTIELELKIRGSKVSGGAVEYAGPGQCYLSTNFTARRVTRS